MSAGRKRLWLFGLGGLVLLGVVAVSLVVLLKPLPPRELVLATGPPGGAYARMGERYRALLAKDGVRLILRPSAGSVENLALLNDPRSGVSAGFVQAGTTSESASPGLVSLGAMFNEMLWLFCRCEADQVGFQDMVGRRFSIGAEGSGTRALALRLLALNGVEAERVTLLDLPPEIAADRLQAGAIDGVVVLTSWDAPVVRRLLADPTVNLVGFPRADAYVALLPFLEKVVVPMGVGNLAANRPPKDVTVLRTKASLAVRKTMHPALQYLLVRAARDAGGAMTSFDPAGAFPAPLAIDLPLSDEAQTFYKSGPSLLQRHLPFWLAEIVSRVLFGLLPIVGVLYPIWSLAPRAYSSYMQWRIYRHYLELRKIERAWMAASGAPAPELSHQLDDLVQRVAELHAPAPFAAAKYQLQAHVHLVAQKLKPTA